MKVKSRIRNRNRIEILCEILQVANGGITTKMKIMYKVNLSYAQLKEHLIYLTEKGLLRYDLERHAFKTTEKGLKFLKAYDQMIYALAEKPNLSVMQ